MNSDEQSGVQQSEKNNSNKQKSIQKMSQNDGFEKVSAGSSERKLNFCEKNCPNNVCWPSRNSGKVNHKADYCKHHCCPLG